MTDPLATLRERAEAATPRPGRESIDGNDEYWLYTPTSEARADAAHIATWSPDLVLKALAVLEAVSEHRVTTHVARLATAQHALYAALDAFLAAAKERVG